MKEAKYVPSGELQGDSKAMPDSSASRSGDFGKSLGEASKGDLLKGYSHATSIKGETKSDKGFA